MGRHLVPLAGTLDDVELVIRLTSLSYSIVLVEQSILGWCAASGAVPGAAASHPFLPSIRSRASDV